MHSVRFPLEASAWSRNAIDEHSNSTFRLVLGKDYRMGASLRIFLLTSQSHQTGTNVCRGRGESSKVSVPRELHDTFDDNPK